MTEPSSSAVDPRPVREDGFAGRILQRAAGSPGLVDAGAIQAQVAHRVEWLARSFPLLPRLLARAATGEADGFAGSAPELATPWAFYLGDLLSPSPATPSTPRFGELPASTGLAEERVEAPSPLSRPTDSPQRLMRVSRVRPGGSAPAGSGYAARMVTDGPASPPAATQQIGTAATTPAAPLRVAPAPGREERDAAPVIARASPAPWSSTLSLPGRSADRGAPAVVDIAGMKERSRPRGAPVAPVPSVRALLVPRAETGFEATIERFSSRVTSPPESGANNVLTTRTSVVSELPAPRIGTRAESTSQPLSLGAGFLLATGVNQAPMATASVVPELLAHSSPRGAMVLLAASGEGPQVTAASRPGTPPARLAPVEPSPAVPLVPKPVIPPASAIAGAELDRLAEKVSRVIARRVAIERERRGR